jgi:hypothetical protein
VRIRTQGKHHLGPQNPPPMGVRVHVYDLCMGEKSADLGRSKHQAPPPQFPHDYDSSQAHYVGSQPPFPVCCVAEPGT